MSFADFDSLFDRWAQEALRVAGFAAEKPSHGERIPDAVKRKVSKLWEQGICYADVIPARFRMADASGGAGGPYKWFTCSSSSHSILPNWEYFVQLAAFHDLVDLFGYDPKWMKFEYHESIESVWVSIDVGIKAPEGPKVFVEVKETKAQWENLLHGILELGRTGVDLTAPDRGNDALRKAKFIVAAKPIFFVGYSPEGFCPFRVLLLPQARFALEPTQLPKRGSSPILTQAPTEPTEKVTDPIPPFLMALLDFLEDRLRNPAKVIEYLLSRKRCSDSLCREHGCASILRHLPQTKPWQGQQAFFEWAWRWYASYRYEEPFDAVFVLPVVAEFLARQGYDEPTIQAGFHMEFKGGGQRAANVPPCLWKGQRPVCIKKIYLNHQMCCDFCLLPPFPKVVAEVKVVVPETAGSAFDNFSGDLRKCREWLADDASPFIQDTFGIDRFDYALAILIDLTDGSAYRRHWEAGIDEEGLRKEGVVVRVIEPKRPALEQDRKIQHENNGLPSP
ncbi:MAG: hypothetical protein HYU36_00190 [Planctomycetes bacterium]|nr:hypothetical protein [Planctomycetota bacterium]